MDEADIVQLLEELRQETLAALKDYGQKLSRISTTFSQNLQRRELDKGFHSFEDIQDAIEEKLKLVAKVDKIMTLLSYRAYKIRCDFCDHIDELQEKQDDIKRGQGKLGSQSQATALIQVNEDLVNTADDFETEHEKIKQQSLEAQKFYESYVEVLDEYLNLMRKHYGDLEELLEVEKQYGGKTAELVDLDELSQTIQNYEDLQAKRWKRSSTDEGPVRGRAADARRYKFSVAGLMITDSGRTIGYKEALEKGLLKNINLFHMDDKDASKIITAKVSLKVTPEGLMSENAYAGVGGSKSGVGGKADKEKDGGKYKQKGKGSDKKKDGETDEDTDSVLQSQDVAYLKEYLGTPLTLALAEITAVQPKDPIHYLAHWLFKFRYNQETADAQRIELDQLKEERERIAQDKWQKFIEKEARAAVIDMIVRAEEEAIENEQQAMAPQQFEAQTSHVMFRDDELMDNVYTYDHDVL